MADDTPWYIYYISNECRITGRNMFMGRRAPLGRENYKILAEYVRSMGGIYCKKNYRFQFVFGIDSLLEDIIERYGLELNLSHQDTTKLAPKKSTKEDNKMLKIEKVTLINGTISKMLKLGDFLAFIQEEQGIKASVSILSSTCKSGKKIIVQCNKNIAALEDLMDKELASGEKA